MHEISQFMRQSRRRSCRVIFSTKIKKLLQPIRDTFWRKLQRKRFFVGWAFFSFWFWKWGGTFKNPDWYKQFIKLKRTNKKPKSMLTAFAILVTLNSETSFGQSCAHNLLFPHLRLIPKKEIKCSGFSVSLCCVLKGWLSIYFQCVQPKATSGVLQRFWGKLPAIWAIIQTQFNSDTA